jgi:hypothetical protein
MRALKDRIAEAMSRNPHLSQADIARACGVKTPSVADWINGKTKTLKADSARLGAKLFGCDQNWLATGVGLPHWGDEKASTPPASDGVSGKAQSVSHLGHMIEPTTIKWESIMSTKPLPALFKAVIEDDAMAPEFPRGCLVTFSTEEGEPRARDAVLVSDAEGGLHFREYQVGRGKRWKAVAINSGYQALDSEEDGLQVVAISMGRWGRRG